MKSRFIILIILLLLGFYFQSCQRDKESTADSHRSFKTLDEQSVSSRSSSTTPAAKPNIPPPPPPMTREAPIQEEMEDTYFFQKQPTDISNEDYQSLRENDFFLAKGTPLSTFSIDVDRASYSNIRRFLTYNQRPPASAIRIEEMVNYFDYAYEEPKDEKPFSVVTEMGECPWNQQHKLVQIGLKGKSVIKKNIPATNLVFLIDVSGSMGQPNKLPLLKSAFKLLTQQLRSQDRVSMVVYAGASGVVLQPTPGNYRQQIMDALDRLQAGGSTAGASGIQLAYQIAEKAFISNGNNRVILATDGDFNVGLSETDALVKLIENKRKSGVFLSVLGFGMGNYKDHRMEQIADKGNGNYAYIDNIREAKKVLVEEMTSTLFTIAKDVKIQVEFNPAKVASYRLIGYENRLLNKEDFNDDTKDAGEIGAGHSVTALYEIVPKSIEEVTTAVDELRYQSSRVKLASHLSDEWLSVKLRYKLPDAKESTKLTYRVKDKRLKWEEVSDNFQFSAAVASFGMLLKNSKHSGNATFNRVEQWALDGIGKDELGYRAEFLELVGKARVLR